MANLHCPDRSMWKQCDSCAQVLVGTAFYCMHGIVCIKRGVGGTRLDWDYPDSTSMLKSELHTCGMSSRQIS